MKNDFTPKSRKDNLVVQELDGEVLIYDLNKNKAVCLNQTSALVWQACDGSRTIADISDAVGKQLNSQVNEDIIWLALDQLSKENLVEKQTVSNDKFKGLSRREVIKKVGLGTMIALPIVTSLVAP
ncbi:MAG TPA: PqqD family protein, partial [Pyrinomonadaceae bacterium]|nr:PqqD family protein [Pyrinomonadaceae bacterium]